MVLHILRKGRSCKPGKRWWLKAHGLPIYIKRKIVRLFKTSLILRIVASPTVTTPNEDFETFQRNERLCGLSIDVTLKRSNFREKRMASRRLICTNRRSIYQAPARRRLVDTSLERQDGDLPTNFVMEPAGILPNRLRRKAERALRRQLRTRGRQLADALQSTGFNRRRTDLWNRMTYPTLVRLRWRDGTAPTSIEETDKYLWYGFEKATALFHYKDARLDDKVNCFVGGDYASSYRNTH